MIAIIPPESNPLNNFRGALKSESNHPVHKVDWNEAKVFCRKLSEITSKQFGLPTEGQWEYACRAGTDTRFFFGNKTQYLCKYGNLKAYNHTHFLDKESYDPLQEKWTESDSNMGKNFPVQVGQYKSNPWGLHDMLGNVWEWCEDDWIDGYHQHPCDGSAIITESNVKVVRGGSFKSSQLDCCSFSRGFRNIDDVDANVGVRIVCVA
jgi:formylglycine-generating enzyme required for sulfatase activity